MKKKPLSFRTFPVQGVYCPEYFSGKALPLVSPNMYLNQTKAGQVLVAVDTFERLIEDEAMCAAAPQRRHCTAETSAGFSTRSDPLFVVDASTCQPPSSGKADRTGGWSEHP